MMLVDLPFLHTLCAITGVVSHKLYWSRYEFDSQLPQILLTVILTYVAVLLSFAQSQSLASSSFAAAQLLSTYFVALFSSITIYRLFYHPVRRFPGPFWARLSAWWKVKNIAEAGALYALGYRLHEQYGDVVRSGPNNISVNSIEALEAIYGSRSPCTKPPSYLIGGLVSVQSERDPHRHRLRRAIWDKALGTNASNKFYPRLEQSVQLLVDRIAEHDNKEISVNDWMHFVTFDVMAQFVFSTDWNQLKSGKMHAGITYASNYLKFAVFGTQVPWLAISLMKIPFAPEPQSAMMEFSAKALDERMEKEPAIPDAMSHILNEKAPEAQQFLSRHDLESDVFMIILAGADTSFSTLINLCFYLAIHPDYQQQLRTEVSPAFSTNSIDQVKVDWPILSSLPLLGALINETLRLHPPVPAGMPRLAPPEGLQIPIAPNSNSNSTETTNDKEGENRFLSIPGNAVVSVPTYTIHRSPKYWGRPHEFIPERWTSQPELIVDKRAWTPFSLGPYACAGKYFALVEIRLIMARLVTAFDIQLTRDMTPVEIDEWLARQDDWMTLQPSPLKLKFVKRE